MKHSITLVACCLILASSCKKVKYSEKEAKQTPYGYSKIEAYFMPVEDGRLQTAKRRLYLEKHFDENGNLIQMISEPYPYKPADAIKITYSYKYENNKRVEETDGSTRFVCTYTATGDTLELKQYTPVNTLVRRSVYTYGSNGKKSTRTYYDLASGVPEDRSTYTYNDKNLLIGEQSAFLLPQPEVTNTIVYTYNSHGNVIKRESKRIYGTSTAEFSYVYNDKGWMMESISTYPDVPEPFKRVYTYNNEGLLIKQDYSFLGHDAIIDYVYTKRQ
ncbi:hypothetical protein [Pedobacter psychroterrae]|uniref:YD repeat-containing protein n=1 Tax=Pedobacter psychroterrae TaxID=2530453 RepID=A0A4R0NPX8_9SPHI|nr:hypothetical protein [Pedobacter psychroterrae]TCD02866.1 hypothetical protein EZ437_02440 [Pedobacter psychroterrae]